MPKVSVIIPVYKVEQYLADCLDSMSRQTFQDFELILVDDGSPDACGAICDAYAAEHPNTRVIHQENMGLSEARNQGVKAAAGEFVAFIDSDDYVAADYIEYLFDLSARYGADVTIAENTLVWDGQEVSDTQPDLKERKLTPEQALKEICYGGMGIYAWGKLYRRELAEKHPYPKGQLYEDTATTYKLIGDAKTVAYGNRVVYYWRQRSGSITHQKITERHLYGIQAAKDLLEYMEANYPAVVPAARVRFMMKGIDLSYKAVMAGDEREMLMRIRRKVIPMVSPVLKDKKASISLKARALALKWGYVPYWLISKLYSLIKRNDLP